MEEDLSFIKKKKKLAFHNGKFTRKLTLTPSQVCICTNFKRTESTSDIEKYKPQQSLFFFDKRGKMH